MRQNSVNLAYFDHSLEPEGEQKRLQRTNKNAPGSRTRADALFSESPPAPRSQPAYSAFGRISVRPSCLISKLRPVKRNKVGGTPTRAVPIIILTANVSDTHPVNGRGAGSRSRSRQKNSDDSGLQFIHDTQSSPSAPQDKPDGVSA